MDPLKRFPRPNVAVDVAVLTVIDGPETEPKQLAVLVLERDDDPTGSVLPGRFLREGESVRDCVTTALAEKAGIRVPPLQPRLLHVFDDPGRDPRGWTISLAHALALPEDHLLGSTGQLVPVTESGALANNQHLLFDHNEIVNQAVTTLRQQYEVLPDPDGILHEGFTLAELQATHEAVLGHRLRRDTFRRRMEPQLEAHVVNGEQAHRSDGGRPARLWRTRRVVDVTTPSVRGLKLPRA